MEVIDLAVEGGFKTCDSVSKLGLGRVNLFGNLVCKRFVTVGKSLTDVGIRIVQLLKLLCDGRKVNVKCYRNRNILCRHSKAIRTTAVIGCGKAVECNRPNKIAEIGVNRNGHGITDGGSRPIDGEATAGSSSIIN